MDRSEKHSGKAPQRVFSIPPGVPFLPTLAEALVTGSLWAEPRNLPGSADLSEAIIYFPTRRAARAFGNEYRDALHRLTGRKAALLPRVRTLGDLDDDEALRLLRRPDFSQPDITIRPGDPLIVPDAARQRVLAFLLKNWGDRMNATRRRLYDGETPVLPSSASDALRLANQLARFIDQIETEEVDWMEIHEIASDRLGGWWQLTLEFLDIVMAHWPEWLSDKGMVDPANARRLLIEERMRELTQNPPSGPVIAAGSTGSIPATRRLLETIARLPNGAVIVPGLDINLSKTAIESFKSESELQSETALSTHPQFGIVRLLNQLGNAFEDVREIGAPADTLRNRSKLLNRVMLPSEATNAWFQDPWRKEENALEFAVSGLSIIEAANDHEEALAIAIILREALETPEKTAALVTPDRKLARRVSAELERFGITVDDSGGASLSQSTAGNFVRLLVANVFGPKDPVTLAGLLKHDLLNLAFSPKESRRIAQMVELVAIRDQIDVCDVHSIAQRLALVQKQIETGKRVDGRVRNINAEDWLAMDAFAKKLAGMLEPIARLRDTAKPTRLQDLASGILETALAISKSDNDIECLPHAPGGEALVELLQSHALAADDPFEFDAYESVAVIDALMAGQVYRTGTRAHPRLHIFGQLEARLQHADLMILAGLNEGTWPQNAPDDPFLNRPMKAEIGLALPERRIGLAAHDFVQFSGASEVVYTRSKRSGDSPTVASRWLQRLYGYLGEKRKDQLLRRGELYLSYARAIDDRGERQGPATQPCPKPPVAARPKRLSITEIETWIRDPYAIYAKHILKLQPLPPLNRTADPGLRGQLYHEILASFIQQAGNMPKDEARTLLAGLAENAFSKAQLPDETALAWRHHFERIADGFLDWEFGRRESVAKSWCEVPAEHEMANGKFILRGIADRIDGLKEGKVAVIDYKTGSYPSKKVARLLAPQLALEGALVARGAFTGIGPAQPASLSFVRLRPRSAFEAEDISFENNKIVMSAEAISEDAYQRLIAHIIAYQGSEQGYLSRYAPALEQEMSGTYDHLARVREWSIGEDADGVNS